MAISRVSTSYQTTGSTTSTSATISAYNPNFTGNETGRFILIAHRSAAAAAGAIGSVTYGGQISNDGGPGGFINNGVASHGIFIFFNPPIGAQDIVFTTVGATNWNVRCVICAYGSNTDRGFRITDKTLQIGSSVTELTTTLTTSASICWSMSMTSCAAQLQTLTTGSFLDGDANPGNFVVSDSGAEISNGTTTGIGCTIPSSSTIFQDLVCISPIRRGLMYFFT